MTSEHEAGYVPTILVVLPTDQAVAGVTKALADYPGGAVCLTASDSTGALQQVAAQSFDLALIAADLRPLDGFSLARQILANAPAVGVLMLSTDPSADDYRQALRSGARDMLRVPIDKPDLLAAVSAALESSRQLRMMLDDIAQRATAAQEAKPGTRIVVFSTKGGTGKTFLSSNLAAGLASSGKSVALVDLDLQFGDSALVLGMRPERTLYDLVQTYREFDLTLMREFMLKHSSGLHLLPAPLYPDEGEQVTVEDVQSILDVIQYGYDYIVIDTPPFFEDRVMVALDWADIVFFVASMDLPSLKNLKVSLNTMHLIDYPAEKLSLVLNRADTKVGLELADVEASAGRKVDYSISSSIDVPQAINAGEVLVLTRPKSKVAEELQTIVHRFEVEGQNGKKRTRLFRK